jgi:hypothetical protein
MVNVSEPWFPIDLVRRIRLEYLETPGLSLTVAQVRRLFSADIRSCGVALAALLDAGLLARRGHRYVRTRPDEMSLGTAMRSRSAPWDCRWAEPVLVAPAPLWLDTLCRSWTCLRDGGPQRLDACNCQECPRWEPRLATRRRDQRRGRKPSESGIRS